MRDHLENDLFNIEPRFFQHKDNMQASLMEFGFACGDGWYNLVRSCITLAHDRGVIWDQSLTDLYEHTDIEPAFDGERLEGTAGYHPSNGEVGQRIKGWYTSEHAPHPNPFHPDNFEVRQVKEKFGGLRFYKNGGDKRYNEHVQAMQIQSYYTCEECGDPGTFRGDLGWVRTLCTACYEDIR